MLKIGLFGVGHLGKIHLKCIGMAADHYELTGFYDPDKKMAEKVAAETGVTAFESPEVLFEAVDVVDIVTPTVTHYKLAKAAIEHGKHVFIEKPLTHTLEEAKDLLKKSKEKGVKVQVGHVERFNPALLALGNMKFSPMFIEGDRLAMFNPRGTDVSVILDLMIHDLDIVLSLIDSELKEVSASGVAVVSNSPDIANARLEFENGCVVNLTASRISLKQMRKLRLFQKDAYISLDFLEKQAQVVRMFEKGDPTIAPSANVFELETQSGTRLIQVEMPPIEPVNAIKMELESFAESIRLNKPVRVPIEDGYRALEVANIIMKEIDRRNLSV